MTSLVLLAADEPSWISLWPEAASRQAETVDALFLVVLALSGVTLAALVLLVGWFCVRYRAGSRTVRHDLGGRTLRWELSWTLGTLLVFVGLFAASAVVFFGLERPPPDALRLHVVGKQWMWKVQHPGGQREINELHVPVGRPVELVLTSQDAIHSFFVPAFRLKQDALPDRFTSLWFEATRPGTYDLFCAEFCGTDHSSMRGRVVVMTPEAFAEWLGPGSREPRSPEAPGGPGAPLALGGKGRFFALGCNACHVPSARLVAPRLDGLWGRPVALRNGEEVVVDDDYVRESILDPNAKLVAGYPAPSLMPTYRGQVSEEDLRELVEFVRSLRDGWWEAPGND